MRSGGQTGLAPLRGGWEGEGVPTPGGTLGGLGDGGSKSSISPAQLGPGKPAGLPGWVLRPLRPPPGHVAPRGIGGRQGEKRRGGRGGALFFFF